MVDFGGRVKSIGEDIDIQLVIFGDPRIGVQALSADKMAALELPGKVLVYGTPDGSAMAYEVPTEMLAERNTGIFEDAAGAIRQTFLGFRPHGGVKPRFEITGGV